MGDITTHHAPALLRHLTDRRRKYVGADADPDRNAHFMQARNTNTHAHTHRDTHIYIYIYIYIYMRSCARMQTCRHVQTTANPQTLCLAHSWLSCQSPAGLAETGSRSAAPRPLGLRQTLGLYTLGAMTAMKSLRVDGLKRNFGGFVESYLIVRNAFGGGSRQCTLVRQSRAMLRIRSWKSILSPKGAV